jgi:antitoxin MazE
MRTRIQKWGNSLALRIPKAFAAEAHLQVDTLVEISVEDGKLVMTPVGPVLADLLAGVTEDNIHREVDTGPAMGNEAW